MCINILEHIITIEQRFEITVSLNMFEHIITIEQRFEITVSLNMFALNFGNRP